MTPALINAGTGAGLLRALQWVAPLQVACNEHAITNPLRIAAFLASVGHESAGLSALVENLNYSEQGLLDTFPTHFTRAQAADYAHQPERIANYAYAGRNGNGDEASGDGWTYRARGCIGITGRGNYRACGVAIGLDLVAHPELLEQDANAAMASAWWWDAHKLNAMADAGQLLQISKVINLGNAASSAMPNGYPHRLALYVAAKKTQGLQ